MAAQHPETDTSRDLTVEEKRQLLEDSQARLAGVNKLLEDR
jgi:hypothetical protein